MQLLKDLTMNPIILALLQIFTFLASHKDALKQTVLDIETLIPDAPGSVKAAQFKAFIASALGIESQIEAVWPMAAGVFNLFVAKVKGSSAPAPVLTPATA
jgi:uncharacterized BrkB/YihY/UPF0761 family membrane protein